MSAEETLSRWEGIAHTAIRGVYAHGFDHDDLLQEARLGMVQAYAAWDRQRPFGPLAYAIARRRVLEAVQRAGREKRGAHDLTMSLDFAYHDRDGKVVSLAERVAAPGHVEDGARLHELLDGLDRLTVSERRAVVGVALGFSYEEIGQPRKHLDNAVQRGRAKLREAA